MKSKVQPPASWRKYSFYFDTTEQCNRMALPLAAYLRTKVSFIYYARYTNAHESRLDVYFLSPKPMPASSLLRAKGLSWAKLVGPEPCEGSFPHAAAFEVVARLFAVHDDPKVRAEQFYDVLHWMNNMAGFDYVDEVRGACYSINKVMGVFEQSIKLGNQMTKAAHKATRRGKSHLN